MATIKWDAYQTLQITRRTSVGMTCVSYERHGNRCRWDPPPENYQRVREILSHMETLLPTSAIPWFPELARLSLCTGFHGRDAAKMVREWTGVVNEAEALGMEIERASRERWENEVHSERVEWGREKKELKWMLKKERIKTAVTGEEWKTKFDRAIKDLEDNYNKILETQRLKSNGDYMALVSSTQIQTEQTNATIAELETQLEGTETALMMPHVESTEASECAADEIARKNQEIEELRNQLRARNHALKTWENKSKEQEKEIRTHLNQITDLSDNAKQNYHNTVELIRSLKVSREALKMEKEEGDALHARAMELTQTINELRSSLCAVEKMERELRSKDEEPSLKLISEGKQFALRDQNESPTLSDANDKLESSQRELKRVTEELQKMGDEHTKSVNELQDLRKEVFEKEVSSDQDRKKSQEELAGLKRSLGAIQEDLARITNLAEIARGEEVAKELRLNGQIAALNRDIEYNKHHLVRSFFRGLRHRIGHWGSSTEGHEMSEL